MSEDQASRPLIAFGMVVALLTAALDQAIKLWLLYVFDIGRRGAVPLTSFFDLVLVWNTGISYGLLPDGGGFGPWALLAVKVVAVLILLIWLWNARSRLVVGGLGLIIGGAIGNAVDRILHGAVVDYALFHAEIGGKAYNWYVFNLADVAIVAGVAALLYDSLRGGSAKKAP
jgi:signal peptidase II